MGDGVSHDRYVMYVFRASNADNGSLFGSPCMSHVLAMQTTDHYLDHLAASIASEIDNAKLQQSEEPHLSNLQAIQFLIIMSHEPHKRQVFAMIPSWMA